MRAPIKIIATGEAHLSISEVADCLVNISAGTEKPCYFGFYEFPFSLQKGTDGTPHNLYIAFWAFFKPIKIAFSAAQLHCDNKQ
ncbi:hypothetical protein GCM10027284_42440 [Cyclobacterium sediminis]